MKIAPFDLLLWDSLRLTPINSNDEVQRNKCVYVVDGNQSSSYSLFHPLTYRKSENIRVANFHAIIFVLKKFCRSCQATKI